MDPRLATKGDCQATARGLSTRRGAPAGGSAEWRVPAEFAEELGNAFVTELEMTKVMDGDKRLAAVNRGRLTKTYRQWFRSRFPGKAHLMPGGGPPLKT